MKIDSVHISNFRIFKNISLTLEAKETVIIGRNNSGKTSLTEVFRRLFSESSPKFLLEDFSLSAHELFWDAYQAHIAKKNEEEIYKILPTIEIIINFSYDKEMAVLGALTDFIIDVNVDSNTAVAIIRYQLRYGTIGDFFDKLKCRNEGDEKKQKTSFFREIKERIPYFYITTLIAQDPSDSTNQKNMELTQLQTLLQVDFINAQRGLDDSTHKEKNILGKILERLLQAAASEESDENDKKIVEGLENAVQSIQEKLDGDFSEKLSELLPTLSIFGYPGLGDPNIRTETILDVRRLLGDNTKIRYASPKGVNLPETYNGLGSRNLIYMLLQIHEFFKSYKAKLTTAGIHLVFIEEPEAHLHPQMQEVFVRKINEIANFFAKHLNEGNPWPVQFIITTHSTHIANESPFECIRYFLSHKNSDEIPETIVKDLRIGINGESWKSEKEFLHKYLTLTKCDLFFADKAIIIEGQSERLMLPEMIKKIDSEVTDKLSSQYISIIEVGGAYAHLFFGLFDFLELKVIIITDIDSVDHENEGTKCKVSKGTRTSNACIKTWFNDKEIKPSELIKKTNTDKIKGFSRLVYQIPEVQNSNLCGRSFEDAFMIANPTHFGLQDKTEANLEEQVWNSAITVNKAEFAIKYSIDETDWQIPLYIKDGLVWLSGNDKALKNTSAVTVPSSTLNS